MKRLFFEQLEDRRLLTGDVIAMPWQSFSDHFVDRQLDPNYSRTVEFSQVVAGPKGPCQLGMALNIDMAVTGLSGIDIDGSYANVNFDAGPALPEGVSVTDLPSEQNLMNVYDVNADGKLTPQDPIMAISQQGFSDINGDGFTTPIDGHLAIRGFRSGAQMASSTWNPGETSAKYRANINVNAELAVVNFQGSRIDEVSGAAEISVTMTYSQDCVGQPELVWSTVATERWDISGNNDPSIGPNFRMEVKQEWRRQDADTVVYQRSVSGINGTTGTIVMGDGVVASGTGSITEAFSVDTEIVSRKSAGFDLDFQFTDDVVYPSHRFSTNTTVNDIHLTVVGEGFATNEAIIARAGGTDAGADMSMHGQLFAGDDVLEVDFDQFETLELKNSWYDQVDDFFAEIGA